MKHLAEIVHHYGHLLQVGGCWAPRECWFPPEADPSAEYLNWEEEVMREAERDGLRLGRYVAVDWSDLRPALELVRADGTPFPSSLSLRRTAETIAGGGDLDRAILLYRLELMEIEWGETLTRARRRLDVSPHPG